MTARAFLAALRLPRPAGAVVTIVGRPGSPVAHLYVGPKTPSGFVPRRSRPVCGARTRRLSILELVTGVLDVGGRRVCARCVARLNGPVEFLNSDNFKAAYAHLTVRDLVCANELVTSTDESHLVGRLALVLFDPPLVRLPTKHPATQQQVELFYLHQRIIKTRDRVRAAERTPEEVEANRIRREADMFNRRQTEMARRAEARATRTQDRDNRGQYVPSWERGRTEAGQ